MDTKMRHAICKSIFATDESNIWIIKRARVSKIATPVQQERWSGFGENCSVSPYLAYRKSWIKAPVHIGHGGA